MTDTAKHLLRKYFHVRRSAFALQSPDRKAPGPIYTKPDTAEELLDSAIHSHLTGKEAIFENWHNRVNPTSAAWRLGAYTLNEDSFVANVCIDIDGGTDHSLPVQDVDTLVLWLYTWCTDNGFHPYMEKSGSGTGWHLWLFFMPLVRATEAKRFGRWVASQVPEHLLELATPFEKPNGDIITHATLEVFPKQTKCSKTGNMVYDPWWHGGKDGGSQFYTPEMELLTPKDIGEFKTTHIPTIAELAEEIEQRAPVANDMANAPRPDRPTGSRREWDKDAFEAWKREMEDAVNLDAVYGQYLTGNEKAGGWLECRDPDSPTGDRNPSAGVYSARDGQHPRGRLHSFRSGTNKDIIQFVLETGGAVDFADACRLLAGMTGTEGSCPFTRRDGTMRQVDGQSMQGPPPEDLPEPEMNHVSDPGPAPTSDPRNWSANDLLPPGISHMPVDHGKPRICTNAYTDDIIVSKAVSVLSRRNMRKFQLFRKDQGEDGGRVLIWNGRKLVDIMHDKHGEVIMSLLLMSNIDWFRTNAAGDEFADRPPYRLNFAILERLKGALPEVEYVVSRPCFMQNGKMCLKQGYHADNKVYNESDFSHYDVPLKPTKNDIKRSLAIIDAVIADFPFKSQRDKDFYLVGLMQQFVRLMMISPTPIYVFTALGPGAGKTLLARVIQSVSGGKAAKLTAFAPGQEAEFEKQTVSIFRNDVDSVLIDNVKDTLESAYLEGIITSFKIEGRLLGASQMLEFTNSCIWLITSNKARLSSDLARRSLRIELKSKGGSYRIKNLDKFVEHNKQRIRESIMTVIQYWISHGAMVPSNLPLLESFESWSEIMAGILASIGRTSFCDDVQTVVSSHDPVDEHMAMMQPSWSATYGEDLIQAKEIYGLMDGAGVLLDLPYNRSVSSFAKWLRRIAEQKKTGGYTLRSVRNRATGVWEYQLFQNKKPELSVERSLVEDTKDIESISLLNDDLPGMNDKLLDKMMEGYKDPYLPD